MKIMPIFQSIMAAARIGEETGKNIKKIKIKSYNSCIYEINRSA
jgi:hypothetical protein